MINAKTTSRRLDSSSDQVISLVQLYLIDNPGSDDYPEPVQMIPLLQEQISYINSSLNNFNVSDGIKGQEVVLSMCSFYKSPFLLGTFDYESISVGAALNQGGYLFGIAVPSLNDTGTPLAFQVAAGLDAANRVANFEFALVQIETDSNLTFTNLVADSDYNIYIVCGNLIPKFPQLSSDVVLITWKTDMKPAPTLLKISGSVHVNFTIFIILMIILC